ncbi:SDR family oxidoreductase [Pontixanthobacter sp. CEM42]|uniref:SDR family oxidoreductase n=1 Tax=Pontixanthobacter sp. CEM42 TaxID=2792077 RepID=UPI001AE04C97|nr:SDR family oxidoreductase [Pontixanthobacter sp. CEM42]
MSGSRQKSIFITGAGQGIGYASAKRFANEGWRVGATDVSAAGLDKLRAELGDDHFYERLDVTDSDAFEGALSKFGAVNDGVIDCMLNNAGVLFNDHFERVSLEQHKALMAVNANGVLCGAYLAFPYLSKSDRASLINLSSGSADRGVPSIASYSASKFFVRGLTEALAIEWKRHGIHVCAIAPHFVATEMTQGDRSEIFTANDIVITAENVADAVWNAAQSRSGHYDRVEGFRAKVERKLAAILPNKWVQQVMAKAANYPF